MSQNKKQNITQNKRQNIEPDSTFATAKLAKLSLFAALAMAIYGIESLLPPIVPIPGIKPGLSNIITLIVLKNYSGRDAFMVLITRILLSSLLFGQLVSMAYSLAGGVLCLIVMLLLNRLLSGHMIFVTSMAGAIFHNIGQLALAVLITATPGVWSYFPFLMLSGIITGLFTGLCASVSQKYLSRFML
jgi:heptaprenyl diphosphate synthase